MTRRAPELDELWRRERIAYDAMKAAEARVRSMPPGPDRASPSVEYESAFYAWNAILGAITKIKYGEC